MCSHLVCSMCVIISMLKYIEIDCDVLFGRVFVWMSNVIYLKWLDWLWFVDNSKAFIHTSMPLSILRLFSGEVTEKEKETENVNRKTDTYAKPYLKCWKRHSKMNSRYSLGAHCSVIKSMSIECSHNAHTHIRSSQHVYANNNDINW